MSMKFILTFILCSTIEGNCIPPYGHAEKFNDVYDCMVAGYKESLIQLQEIGREEINKHQLFIKFGCYPVELNEDGVGT